MDKKKKKAFNIQQKKEIRAIILRDTIFILRLSLVYCSFKYSAIVLTYVFAHGLSLNIKNTT